MANLKNIIEESFTQYSGAVLQSRALVDVRDGLKPSARQVFYCLYTDKFTSDKPFKKTLKALGSASRMYIHGDSSCTGIIMRAGQPFAMRYPLIEIEGNCGTLMESGNWAAARYTSSRLEKISNYLFNGIKKNTIEEWRDNYDNTEQYPSVLPSIGVYGLVNGTMGIGIGASSSIPPTNLKELNEAIIKLIQNPDTSFEDIICYPDFPTGATLINKNEVKESLRNGQGNSCKIRATITYNPDENCLIVTEIPYSVYTNTICKELETLQEEEGESFIIDKWNDITGELPLIEIYLKKGIDYNKAIKYLYKNTSLESYFGINLTMLKDGKYPVTFTWKQCLQEYITHIRTCKTREIQFDLDKALTRKNIVEGLVRAYSIIDSIVALIRGSNSPAEAQQKLINQYQFNEGQAKAILAMKLSALTRLDIQKLNDELAELNEKIEWCNHLLNESTALDAELIKILREVADKFGDERRTKIINLVEPTEEQTPIKEEELAIMLFDNNTIRLIKKDDLQGGKKGRKGINIKPPKNSNLINTLYSTNLGTVAAFTNGGHMYNFSLTSLDYGKDYSIYELIQVQDKEKVILIIDTTSFSAYHNLVTISRNGFIKKTAIKDYSSRTKKGIMAVKLEDDDSLIGVYLSMSDNDRIFIGNCNGNYNFYKLDKINSTGRATKGVKAIKLGSNEYISCASLIKENINYKGILTISSSGRGKITPIEDFPETTKGTKGNCAISLKDETLAVVYAVPEVQSNLYVSAANKAVSLDISSIPTQARNTMGVRIIDARNSHTTIEIL